MASYDVADRDLAGPSVLGPSDLGPSVISVPFGPAQQCRDRDDSVIVPSVPIGHFGQSACVDMGRGKDGWPSHSLPTEVDRRMSQVSEGSNDLCPIDLSMQRSPDQVSSHSALSGAFDAFDAACALQILSLCTASLMVPPSMSCLLYTSPSPRD